MPTTATVYNISAAANSRTLNVRDNADYLDTTYKGIEFTATKRFNRRLADAGGPHDRQERGRRPAGRHRRHRPRTIRTTPASRRASSATIRRPASACRAATSCRTRSTSPDRWSPTPAIPYVSTYSLTQALAAAQGITLTRASQTIQLSERGDERYDNVTIVRLAPVADVPLRRRAASAPQIDFFNIDNAGTIVGKTLAVGPSYLQPSGAIRSCRRASSASASAWTSKGQGSGIRDQGLGNRDQDARCSVEPVPGVCLYNRPVALDERAFFSDRNETRPARYTCTRCRRTNDTRSAGCGASRRIGCRPAPTNATARSSPSSATISSAWTTKSSASRAARSSRSPRCIRCSSSISSKACRATSRTKTTTRRRRRLPQAAGRRRRSRSRALTGAGAAGSRAPAPAAQQDRSPQDRPRRIDRPGNGPTQDRPAPDRPAQDRPARISRPAVRAA